MDQAYCATTHLELHPLFVENFTGGLPCCNDLQCVFSMSNPEIGCRVHGGE